MGLAWPGGKDDGEGIPAAELPTGVDAGEVATERGSDGAAVLSTSSLSSLGGGAGRRLLGTYFA